MALPLYRKEEVYKCLDYVSYEQTYDNQNFVLSYMHPEAPYRGLLLAFQLGNGKTYCAAALAHLYNRYGHSVLFLSHNVGTILNFKREYDGFINDNRLSTETHRDGITYMGLTKFAKSKRVLSRQLVIIDEAHNLRENAARYKNILSKLQAAKDIKILAITATPMIDRIHEIESLRNIIEPNAPVAYSEQRSELNHISIEYVGIDYGYGILYPSTMQGKQLKAYLEEKERKKNDIYTSLRQCTLSATSFDPHLPLREQSSKVHALIEALVPGELTVAFSFYIDRGVTFISEALDFLGWRAWHPSDTPDPRCRRYAVVDGRTSNDKSAAIINTFNSILNLHGELIDLIVGSSVINESITLKNVKHVHILCPFWNLGQIEQAIGRAIRIGSHAELFEETSIVVKVYQHACEESIDLDMYRTAWEKKQSIVEQTARLKRESILDPALSMISTTVIPTPDNRCIVKVDDWVWDFRKCFDTNINKISWCKIREERAIGYHCQTRFIKIGQFPTRIRLRSPYEFGNAIVIWKSCIDQRFRLSDLRGNAQNHSKKHIKRGKLIQNMKRTEITTLSRDLDCEATLPALIQRIRELGHLIEAQVEVQDDL